MPALMRDMGDASIPMPSMLVVDASVILGGMVSPGMPPYSRDWKRATGFTVFAP